MDEVSRNKMPKKMTSSTEKENDSKIKQIKLLEEKINNENFIIQNYNNKLEKLKEKEKLKNYSSAKNIEEKEAIKKTNNIILKLQSKNNSLYSTLNNLKDVEKSLELGRTYNVQEENKTKDRLKYIKKEKEVIQNKIKEIDNQIKIIIDKENIVPPRSKYKLKKNYIANIEEKNIFNNKLPVNKIRSSETSFLKSIEELEKKEEKEKEEKILEKQQLFRNRELEIIRKRKYKVDSMLKVNTPKYIQKKNYTTAEEKEQKRLIEEEALLQKEIKKRKMKLQPISSQELNKFSREVQRNEKLFMEELDEKKIQLQQLWKERKNLLPEYKSKFFEFNKQNEDKMKDELILKKERIKQDVKDRIKYGEDVIKNFQPQLNNNLKNEREGNIKKLKGIDKYKNIKSLDNKLKLLSNRIVFSQPKKFKLTNKFIIDEADGGKRKIKKLVPLEKYKDYLTEKRLEKEQKIPPIPTSNSYEKVNKWKNMLNSDTNIYNNIEKVKIEAKLLQNKADSKKMLLQQEKSVGNVNSVDNLNNEITNLYIGSIQAKLQILKKLGE